MKKISVLLMALLFVMACSKDDSGGLGGVPSGEIVPVAEREYVLTGVDSSTANKTTQAKSNADVEGRAWTLLVRKAWTSGNCSAFLDPDEIAELNMEDFTTAYFKFLPNGDVMTANSIGGTYYNNGSWSWVNPATKDEIEVQYETYTITALNDSQFIIGHNVSEGGCSLTTYQSLSR
ncbi:hypothetical protein [Flavicella sediminum]|uniref:hypothetical protein n=1 Tax=Flavicella sediminum TaxID=2585141 RepID=UPI001121E5E0|nr:hypothetical protein [Flavicella sediminum]